MTSFSSKTAARREALRRLTALGAGQKELASASIRSLILGWSAFKAAKRILLFAGFKSEPDLLPILEKFTGKETSEGGEKQFLFPKVSGESMDTYWIRHSGELVRGSLGVMEPFGATESLVPPEMIDLVLAPGLAFTSRGERLGRGGGYFDRFLTRLGPATEVAGVCFHCQIFGSFPVEAHDIPVSSVISEEGIMTD